MRALASLLRELEGRPRRPARVAALAAWLAAVPPEEAAAASALLLGWRPPRLEPTARLARWAAAAAGVPGWLFDRCREETGDLGEAAALVAPGPEEGTAMGLVEWLGDAWRTIAAARGEERRRAVLAAWARLGPAERLLANRLLGGTFRPPVAADVVVDGLAAASGVPAPVLAARLEAAQLGQGAPDEEAWAALLRPPGTDEAAAAIADDGREAAAATAAPPALQLHAVLLYAKAGHGGRGGQYTELTFGLWSGADLAPVARVEAAPPPGLAGWIRRHTVERFGPVRRVEPTQVFLLAGERLERSPRHKAGWVLRGARVVEWRRDEGPEAVDRLDQPAGEA